MELFIIIEKVLSREKRNTINHLITVFLCRSREVVYHHCAEPPGVSPSGRPSTRRSDGTGGARSTSEQLQEKGEEMPTEEGLLSYAISVEVKG